MNSLQQPFLYRVANTALSAIGWLPLEFARNLDLTRVCSIGDQAALQRFVRKLPNGLSETHRIDMFTTVGDVCDWLNKYTPKMKHTPQQMVGSSNSSEEIKEHFQRLFEFMCDQHWFPQTDEGQRNVLTPVALLDFPLSPQMVYAVNTCALNPPVVQWVTNQILLGMLIHESEKEKGIKHEGNPFQSAEMFILKNMEKIDWLAPRQSSTATDIAPQYAVWEDAVGLLPASVVEEIFRRAPSILNSPRFTQVLQKRASLDVNFIESLVVNHGVKVSRLLHQTVDPKGIKLAVDNKEVQCYTNPYLGNSNIENRFTKKLLEYLTHCEVRNQRAAIAQALEDLPPPQRSRKM